MMPVTKVPLPSVLPGIRVKVVLPCGSLFIRFSWYHDRLVEVFASLGKTGGCAACQSEALMRVISLGLRCGIPVDEFIDQLRNIRCPNPNLFPKEDRVLSCPDAVAMTLIKYGKLTLQEAIALSGNGNASVQSGSSPVVPGTESAETEQEERARIEQGVVQLREERERLEV